MSARTRDAGRSLAPWVAGVALLGTLLLAHLGKAVCIDGESGFWAQTRYCYSDVRVLWSFRGFDVDAVPYAPAPPGYVEDYTFEYPPLLAIPAYLIGLATDSRRGFFDLHAVTFALAAVVALLALDAALRRRDGNRWRLLGFALSPGLVLFGMQNWDLWSVGIAAVGLAAAARGRTTAAAVWFGIGAAVKWWPGLLVVALLAGPWARRRPSDDGDVDRWRIGGFDLRPLATTIGAWLLCQVPAIVISPAGWWRSITFHLGRLPNYDSLASALSAFGNALMPGRFWSGPFSALYTVVSLALLLAGIAYTAYRLRERTLDPADAALAAVALFLLTQKVMSPQFVLWLLPVAVVATVRWTPILAVESSNAAVWLLFGPWMAHVNDPGFSGFLRAAQAMTVVRALTIAWVVVAALLPRKEDPGERHREPDDAGDEAERAALGVPRE